MKNIVRLMLPPLLRAVLSMVLCLAGESAFAQFSPVGLWKTFDDDNGKAKSLIRIVEHQGVLSGHVESLLDPADPADAKCELCTDGRRNQPILGLVVLQNFRAGESKPNRWEGGDILDPENGKLYRAHLTLSQDHRQLDVRGYLGLSIIGRTQHWLRVE